MEFKYVSRTIIEKSSVGINRIIMEFKLLYQGNFLHLQLTGINRIIMEFK